MKHLESGTLRRMPDEPPELDDRSERHAAARRTSPAWYRPSAVFAALAVLVLALIFTPLGGYARSFLTVFEPRQFQPIDVSRADLRDLRLLPQANDVGTQRIVRKPMPHRYAGFAAAAQHVPFALSRPAAAPPHFTAHSYTAWSPGEMTFTFSAAKARAFERRAHKRLAPMPRSLDGTTVRLQTGYVFEVRYRSSSARAGNDRTQFVDVVQAQTPRITSSGASLDTLERYLLSMPNVSPKLAQQIRALGDIQNTVPVPVIVDKQTARRVSVNGMPGLAIGDDTGLGAGVMWQRGGTVYVVAGPVSMDDVMTLADGLR